MTDLDLSEILNLKTYIGCFNGTHYTLGPASPGTMSIQEIFEWIEVLGEKFQIPTLEQLEYCRSTPSLAVFFEPEQYWCTQTVETPDGTTTYGLSYDFFSGASTPNGLTSQARLQLVKTH